MIKAPSSLARMQAAIKDTLSRATIRHAFKLLFSWDILTFHAENNTIQTKFIKMQNRILIST